MAFDETPVPQTENRPPWWKVGVASLAGAVAGAFVFLVVQWPFTFALDQLFGRTSWQGSLAAWPQPLRLALLILYWTVPLVLGQFFSTVMSGWRKAVYFAAGVQTLHLVNIYAHVAFISLWLLPAVIALVLMMTRWATVGAKKGHAIEAMRLARERR